ncbi:MAG: hypothetical protein V5A62_14825 [Haloarculaceae archaeon]
MVAELSEQELCERYGALYTGVVADVDGVTVVPEDVAGEVLEDAEAEKETESELRAAIEDGASALDAYDEYGTF